MLLEFKLKGSDARKLNSFLKSNRCPEDTLTLNGLKGYLFAIVSAPILVDPPEWWHGVFAGGEPEFKDDAESEFVTQSIMALYNQLNGDVLDGKAKLPPNCKLAQPWQKNFESDQPLHQWCLGFMRAQALIQDSWIQVCEELPPDVAEEIAEDIYDLTYFADLQNAIHLRSQLGFDKMPMEEEARRVRDGMSWAMKSLAHVGRAIYEDQMLQHGDELYETDEPLNPDMSPEDQAEELAFHALDAQAPKDQIHFARAALQMDPECVDALIILGQKGSKDRVEALNYFRRAVKAAEKKLGPETMENDAGFFWGLIETRPYMRARVELASMLWSLNKRQEAVDHMQDLLRLNPNDNQGVRYLLISRLLELKEYIRARELLDRFHDGSAWWLYSRALLTYIEEGDSRRARSARKKALEYNPQVVEYLEGDKVLPKQRPEYWGIGDQNEAILYVEENRKIWRMVPDALDWLEAGVPKRKRSVNG